MNCWASMRSTPYALIYMCARWSIYWWRAGCTCLRRRGEHPKGYLIYTPEGRMMVIVVADNRNPPKADEDRIALHKHMVAYSGRYVVNGERVVHHVDVAWNPAWMGTDLV